MSSDDSSNAPSERRDAVREKAQQVQARQARTHRLRIAGLAVSIVAVVAVAAVVVTWAVSSAASKPLLNPANVDDDGFVVTEAQGIPASGSVDSTPAPSDEPTPSEDPATEEATPVPTEQPSVDIRVYVDYLSTGSREFQLANAAQLSKWVSEDAATLSYYPVAMLTAKSNGTKYSLRAASAAACVATHSQDTFFAFNHTLLSRQPDLDSDGFSDEELADIAQASGASSPKVVRECIMDGSFASWVKGATERALKGLPDTDGVALTSAPMVLVNGTPYVGALDDPKEFAQFVLTVASDAYYNVTPSPTPSGTATPAS